MKVLAFVSTATGAGKTTLAAHIAVQAHRCGAGPVAMIDADPRGDLAHWRDARNGPGPTLVEVDSPDIAAAVASLKTDKDGLVIVDTPPKIDAGIETVLGLADLVAIPVRPGQYDLQAAGTTVELLNRLGLHHVFVVNGGSPDADITAESIMALSQHGAVSTAIVPASTEFAQRMVTGQTVFEAQDHDLLAEEVGRLWDYLDRRMGAGGPSVLPSSKKDRRKEPRRFPRWDFDQPATLVAGDKHFPCTVNDISAGGALIFGKKLPGVGERVAIDIAHVGRLNAEIVHHTKNRIGLKFVIGAQQQWTLVRHLSDMIEASRRAYVAAP